MHIIWLMVSTPLKNMTSSVGMMTFHSQLFLESHIKFYGSKSPTSYKYAYYGVHLVGILMTDLYTMVALSYSDPSLKKEDPPQQLKSAIFQQNGVEKHHFLAG